MDGTDTEVDQETDRDTTTDGTRTPGPGEHGAGGDGDGDGDGDQDGMGPAMMTTTPPYYPDEFSTSDFGRVIPMFTIMPETEAYVIHKQPAELVCAAMEATRLIFMCNGERVPKERELNAFKVSERPQGIGRRTGRESVYIYIFF